MPPKEFLYKSRKIYDFIFNVFPLVDKQLEVYADIARHIPDKMLSKQALDSIATKKFHCQGGSVYALYPHTDVDKMIKFIVAYQTISDYLDNLCDRSGIFDETAFRNLHMAMTDALLADERYSDYYRYYPYSQDGGYLRYLVKECKSIVNLIPAYEVIKDKILYLAGIYSDLQVYKHLAHDIREDKLIKWSAMHIGSSYPNLNWWEFAAASGSTLGIFVLVACAFDTNLRAETAQGIYDAYFPWICGLHILLDYYIDLYDDAENGDLNFVSYYNDNQDCEKHLKRFYTASLNAVAHLKETSFHRMVVDGLLAMYLSDPKASAYDHLKYTQEIINTSENYARLLYRICKLIRRRGSL
ncbi:MAG: tetraprenyl-beta-curcumene synthase [Clostridiales bacterium]|nr:tetraprenyl-beta-curcumene synthase [Clostridiales bacterium]